MAKKKAVAKKRSASKKKAAAKKVSIPRDTVPTDVPEHLASRPSESTLSGDRLVTNGQVMACLGLTRSAMYEVVEAADIEVVLQHGTKKYYWLQETAYRYSEFMRLKVKQMSRGQKQQHTGMSALETPHPDSPAGMDLRMQRHKLRQMELKTANLEKSQASIEALERALDIHTSGVRDTVLTTASRMRELFGDRMDHEMYTELDAQLQGAVNEMAMLELESSDFDDFTEDQENGGEKKEGMQAVSEGA